MKDEYKADPTRDNKSLYFRRKGHRENGLREIFKTESSRFSEIDQCNPVFCTHLPSIIKYTKMIAIILVQVTSLMMVLLRLINKLPGWFLLEEGSRSKVQSGDWQWGGGGHQTHKGKFVLGYDDFEVVE